jgi:hypothetical protein
MTTVEYKKNCVLCGQSVEIEGFTVVTETGRQSFCCAGCQSIYQLIYMDNRARNANNEIKTANKEDN